MVLPTYRTHPVHAVPGLEIQQGYAALAAEISRRIEMAGSRALIVVDGFAGVRWSMVAAALGAALREIGVESGWCSTETCFLPAEAINTLLSPVLTADPVFGRLFHGHLEELWDDEAVAACRNRLTERTGPMILFGFGASLLARGDLLAYVDVPKDRGQGLAAGGQVTNLGSTASEPFATMYKRLYFVDWPILNRVKRSCLPILDLYIDLADSEAPCFASGDEFRRALHVLSQGPVRAKPWFAPGPWGGQWMKEEFGLPAEAPNYAWSFELITPENGILLGGSGQTLECSLDYLLWQEADAVLGVSVAARYGSYFPIRFDYLDTMSGTNLSCQVHPRLDYVHAEFGEQITQDETYYIVTCKPESRVFLGLREDADVDRFRAAAFTARDEGIPFEIEDYVNSFESRPHDLFLIPSGTVHCSGADNLVLEISSTPYIFTFKIYDYLRTDLAGKLRHVHPDRAFENIDRTRTTRWVQDNLLPTPTVVRSGSTWAEYCIGDHPTLFFGIHRLEFSDTIEDHTDGKFVALNLVEGESCQIVTQEGTVTELLFAESIIIPAAVGTYSLRNTGTTPCKAVKAFVKG